MQQTSFSPNSRVLLFRQHYQIVSFTSRKELVLRDERGVDKTWQLETLIGHYREGNCKLTKRPEASSEARQVRRITTRLISDASDIAKAEAYARREYLTAIDHERVSLTHDTPRLQHVIQEVTRRLARKKCPSRSSLKNWQRRLRRSGNDPAALLPAFSRRGGPGKSRFSQQAQADMNSVIDNHYLVEGNTSAATAYAQLQACLADRNQWLPTRAQEPVPSYPTFLRMIKRRGGYEVTAARSGAREAERQYRSTGRNTENYGHNECWEIDHTVIDLFVVDPRTGMPLGRPRFTACIDSFSKCIMGIDLDFSGTTTQAVLSCVKHGILPKTYIREKYPKVQGEWPCFGIPRVLKCDNGPEFHSKSLQDACLELGITLQYCPAKQPWFKGSIERFFRTFSEHALAGLPGATGSHLYNRAERKDPASDAVLSRQSLMEYLHIWIVDVYLPGNARRRK